MTPVKEIVFEREYDAPIEAVWQAWTNSAQLKRWWGPDNVTIPECRVDLRVGGQFYIVMEAGKAMGDYAGTRWPMEATITLVEAPSKLTYAAKAWTEGQEATTTIEQTQELNLTHENGKTKLYLKATLTNIGPSATMAAEGMQWGYNQQLDKLTRFLQQA